MGRRSRSSCLAARRIGTEILALAAELECKTNDTEKTRELTEDELAQVSGGIIAILIGLLTPSS